MARIRKGYARRKDGRLMRQFYRDGRRYTVYGKTYDECDKKEAEILNSAVNVAQPVPIVQARAQPEPKKEVPLLDDYFEYWSKKRQNIVKVSTSINVRQIYIGNIKERFGMKRLDEIKRKDAIDFQMYLLNERKLKSTYANSIMVHLHSIMREAVCDGYIEKNPCDNIHRAKKSECAVDVHDTIHRALDNRELQVFFEEAERTYYVNLYKMQLYTGMRIGEACALEWSDIDYKANVIHITKTATDTNSGVVIQTPKTKKSKRDIPLTDEIRSTIDSQRRRCRYEKPKGALFANPRGVSPSPTSVSLSMRHIIQRINKDRIRIEPFSSHAFRNTFATRAVESGMNPETLKGILGHAKISMTMDLYYHLSEEKKQNEMKLVHINF